MSLGRQLQITESRIEKKMNDAMQASFRYRDNRESSKEKMDNNMENTIKFRDTGKRHEKENG